MMPSALLIGTYYIRHFNILTLVAFKKDDFVTHCPVLILLSKHHHTYKHICIYKQISLKTCIYIYINIYVECIYKQISLKTYIYIYINIYIYIDIDICIFIYIYRYIYIHHHRAHASTEGVTAFLSTSVAGFLLQKELDYLQSAVDVPQRLVFYLQMYLYLYRYVYTYMYVYMYIHICAEWITKCFLIVSLTQINIYIIILSGPSRL
jgi:hypothetical protein